MLILCIMENSEYYLSLFLGDYTFIKDINKISEYIGIELHELRNLLSKYNPIETEFSNYRTSGIFFKFKKENVAELGLCLNMLNITIKLEKGDWT